MDAIAAYLGKDRTEVRAANFIQPDEFPYDHGLIFQDGRPLIYDSGDFPASLEKLKELVGWDDFEAFRQEARAEGRRVGIGLACYVEGTGVGPYEGAHIQVETDGKVKVATGLTIAGAGPPDRVRADRRRRARRAVRGRRGHHRRHPAVAVRRGHLRLPRRGDERLRGRARRPPGAGQGAAHRRRGARGVRGRPRDRRRPGAGQGRAGDPASALGTVAVLSNPLRYAFDEASKRATQFIVGDPDEAAGRRGRRARAGGQGLLLAGAVDVRQRHARGDRRDRPGHRRDHGSCGTASSTTAAP